jgi:hypothetical protein
MDNFPLLRRLQYGYLGRLYSLAFWATTHRFLGIRFSTLFKWVPLILLLFGWIDRGPLWLLAVLLLATLWIHLAFWRAQQVNYNHFVANETPVLSADELTPLPPNRRVETRATGLFSVTGRENNVLLQPAKYWQVPLGEHIVMVEERPGKYLYQFFNASALQEVRQGWLIYGRRPLAALAISFLSVWGPAYTNFQIYELGDRVGPPPRKQTIYLTFENDADRRAVWHTIVHDARRARQQST